MITKHLSQIITILSIIIAVFYYRQQFENTDTHNKYIKAIKFIHETIEQNIDYSVHHFDKCKNCGYELALNKDTNYCLKSDTFKILHPETIMNDVQVFRDYGGKDMARQIMYTEYFDSLPRFTQTRKIDSRYYLPITNSIIFPYAKNLFRTHRLGDEVGCLFQKYLHVPGQDEIALKSNQTTHFINYIKLLHDQNKSAECIDDAKYYKETIRLWETVECQSFMQLINSQEYQSKFELQGIQHIYKNNAHLGKGIVLLDQEGLQMIKISYRNGELCGVNKTNAIIQEYITNPFLLKGYKMEFRAYFLIASTDPPLLYAYKVVLIKQCALKFNLHDKTKQGHVCNTAVTKDLKEKQGVKDDSNELYIDWNLEELQEILLREKRITSRDWLNSELRPQIYRKVTHLYQSVRDSLFSDSRVGEFFGVDFIMDDNLRLWILECNRNPNFLAVTEGRKDKFGRLISDILDLNMRLIRSKYVRIKELIKNELLNAEEFTSEHKAKIIDLKSDRLEQEFQLPIDSLLELVYVNSPNKAQFNFVEYIPKQCLIE